jgi:hypothetical protein
LIVESREPIWHGLVIGRPRLKGASFRNKSSRFMRFLVARGSTRTTKCG